MERSMTDKAEADVNWDELRPQITKLALELGPLVVFFIVNARADIFAATAWFMGAMAVSLLLCSRGGAEDPASPRRPVPAGPRHQGSPRCKSISRGDAEPRSAKTVRCRVDAITANPK